MKIKNRTRIAIITSILAVLLFLGMNALLTNMVTQKTTVVRLKENVSQGTRITATHLETVEIHTEAVEADVITDPTQIIGKFAASQLYAGDYITAAKLRTNSLAADDVLATLEGQVAVSVPINSFAGSLSGKIENGDIIRFYVTREGETTTPGALQWVRVITTTTGSGIDQDEIVKNEDGSYDMPSTVTVLVNQVQGELLAHYASEATIHLALIYRGDEEHAQELLEQQRVYIENMAKEETQLPDVGEGQ